MSGEPVKSTLVRWIHHHDGPIGFITEVMANGRQVRVRFDSGEEHTFVWPTDALTRMTFDRGDSVQTQPGGEVGVVTGLTESSGVIVYDVSLPTGSRKILEVGLRPAVITDPVELLRRGELDSARSTNLRLTATRLAFAHQFDELSSLSNSRVEIKPHQVAVVHRAATTYPHRFLLADEVGLGKTIEAGLIIKELKARGVANRVLILAPSGIVSQWQAEMRSKFNMIFSLYRRDSIAYLEANNPGENVWALNDNVLASTTYASWDENRCREIALAGWDLVVIDEAHHARRTWEGEARYRETKLYGLASMLANPEVGKSVGYLLLTATPMQLHRFELYSLVELLDPTLFPNFQEFDDHCDSLGGLSTAVQSLRRWDRLKEPRRASTAAQIAEWLDRPEGEVETLLATPDGRENLGGELARQHRLSEVMIRNRKAIVGGFMPRVAAMWPVRMTDQEREAYEATTSYVQSGYARSQTTQNNALGFVMAIFQKLNSSSSYALRQSLLRRIEKLEAGILPRRDEVDVEEDEIEEKPVEDALGDWLAAREQEDLTREVRELTRIVQLLDAIAIDTKAQVLKERLTEIAAQDRDAKVIIFTQFRDTQEYIKRQIKKPWQVELFHGQLSPADKDEAVRRFREGKGPQLLISTEAGGEGRNFQFCHIMINYDLPWNPMKIEQRIGRIDRVGQRNPVKVFNFSILGTIEERVLDVLSRRIRVFEETIGGLDPVLGDVETDLTKVFLLAEKEARKELARLDRELEARVREAKDAEKRLADLIMDTKSYRQDEVAELLQRKGGLDTRVMQSFVLAALTELGVEIVDDPDLPGVFRLRFQGRFVDDFPQLVREGKIRRVTFEPSVALDYETIEFLAFGHELVDALVERVRSAQYRGRACHRIIRTDSHPPVCGWFFTYILEFEGVVPAKEMLPVFVDVRGAPDDEVASWLIDRSGRLKREDRDWAALPPRDEIFESAVAIAEQRAIERVLARQAELSVANQERLDRERAKLIKFYEYRERAAGEKLESVRRTFERLSASEEPEVQRIVPVWAKNLENAERVLQEVGTDRERRLAQLHGREQVTAQHQMFAASYVEIIPKEADHESNHV
jgi:ATP-dependent helicase HepA